MRAVKFFHFRRPSQQKLRAKWARKFKIKIKISFWKIFFIGKKWETHSIFFLCKPKWKISVFKSHIIWNVKIKITNSTCKFFPKFLQFFDTVILDVFGIHSAKSYFYENLNFPTKKHNISRKDYYRTKNMQKKLKTCKVEYFVLWIILQKILSVMSLSWKIKLSQVLI